MQLILPILLHLSKRVFPYSLFAVLSWNCSSVASRLRRFPGEKGWNREDYRFSRLSSPSQKKSRLALRVVTQSKIGFLPFSFSRLLIVKN